MKEKICRSSKEKNDEKEKVGMHKQILDFEELKCKKGLLTTLFEKFTIM